MGSFIVDADTPYDQQEEVAVPNEPGVQAPFRVSDWYQEGRRLLGWQRGVRVYDLETGEYTKLADGGSWALWMADGRVLMVSRG